MITVIGLGYVGCSISVLLAKENKVIAYDIDQEKVDCINKFQSPIDDEYLSKFLENEKLNIQATTNKKDAYLNSDIFLICTPTDFNEELNSFDTSIIDNVVDDILSFNKDAFIVIKSTVPIGYTETIQKKHNSNNIVFSPEFLREGSALEDNIFPSRIVVGGNNEKCLEFVEILKNASEKKDTVKTFLVSSSEAEAIKLFSNTYLANRVAFFNELDTFSRSNNLSSKNIINGVCADIRIGDGYNNPSFGYGGYCLPKDTKQLLSNFSNLPQTLVKATINSNQKRKEFIANDVASLNPNIIGIYKLSMKKNSDNFRSSAIFDVISFLDNKGFKIVIYEPLVKNREYNSYKLEDNLSKFKTMSDVILANRVDELIEDVTEKVYTCDIFGDNWW